MEDIIHTIFYEFEDRRSLITSVPKWKIALWEKNSIEPAMLRVPLVVIIFIFLWWIDLYLFEKSAMKYQSALSIKAAPLTFTASVASLLAILYAINMTLFSNVLGFSVEFGITFFYLIFLILTLLPKIPGQDQKNSFFRLLRLVVFPSSSGVSFPEILLADALTSLSKILKDIGVTIVAMYSFSTHSDCVMFHEQGMVLISLFASAPFWIRIRQCWIQFDLCNDTISRIPIVLNILKYATAFPPIWLATVASLGYHHPNLPYLTALMAMINSLYSFLWDVFMDWGLVTFNRDGRISLRQRYLWPYSFFFFSLAMILNFILRFSWTANRFPWFSHLHASHLVLIVEVAEVFRRSMWILLRVEWEVIVIQERGGGGMGGKEKGEKIELQD